MHRLPFLPLVAALAAIPSHALANSHDGLFVRVTPGVSGAAASTTVDDAELTVRGAAGRLGLSLGASISPRVVVSAELIGQAVLGPEVVSDDQTHETDDDVSWGVSYAGAGASYYFPSNFYLSGSAGALIMTLETPEMDSETDLGFGAKLAVGQEWWVSRDWGLGLAAELLAGSVPDGDTDWGVATLGLALSATYN